MIDNNINRELFKNTPESWNKIERAVCPVCDRERIHK